MYTVHIAIVNNYVVLIILTICRKLQTYIEIMADFPAVVTSSGTPKNPDCFTLSVSAQYCSEMNKVSLSASELVVRTSNIPDDKQAELVVGKNICSFLCSSDSEIVAGT